MNGIPFGTLAMLEIDFLCPDEGEIYTLHSSSFSAKAICAKPSWRDDVSVSVLWHENSLGRRGLPVGADGALFWSLPPNTSLRALPFLTGSVDIDEGGSKALCLSIDLPNNRSETCLRNPVLPLVGLFMGEEVLPPRKQRSDPILNM